MAEHHCHAKAPSRILVMLLGVLSLLGCSTPPAAVNPQPGASDLPAFLSALTESRGDPAAWAELLDSSDPSFPARAEQLRANLAQFAVRFTPVAGTHPLAEQRRELLGPTALVRAVRADWAVPGHPEATHTFWLTLTNTERGLRLAGVTDGPVGERPVPVWQLGPVRVSSADEIAVVTGPETDPDPWLADLRQAVTQLGNRGLVPTSLIVHVPSESADFQRILGVRLSSHRAVAAVARPFGAAAHIVVNPRHSGPGPTRRVLVTHEAVHVVTGSVQRTGPLWLSEGYADLVALEPHPEVAAAHENHLVNDQRQHGIATALVTDEELAPGNPRVDAHYQRAWVTVRVLDRGDGTADRVHAAVQAGTPLPRALADEGWTEASLAAAVGSELARLAG